jgi:hypothetical protein
VGLLALAVSRRNQADLAAQPETAKMKAPAAKIGATHPGLGRDLRYSAHNLPRHARCDNGLIAKISRCDIFARLACLIQTDPLPLFGAASSRVATAMTLEYSVPRLTYVPVVSKPRAKDAAAIMSCFIFRGQPLLYAPNEGTRS